LVTDPEHSLRYAEPASVSPGLADQHGLLENPPEPDAHAGSSVEKSGAEDASTFGEFEFTAMDAAISAVADTSDNIVRLIMIPPVCEAVLSRIQGVNFHWFNALIWAVGWAGGELFTNYSDFGAFVQLFTHVLFGH
jgi:hypothetical protein